MWCLAKDVLMLRAFAWRRLHRKHSFPYIVAYWEVFNEPLPGNALIKSVTVYSPAGSVSLCPIWPLVHPQNLMYISFETVMREPALYRRLTFHVPNLISIFRSVGRLSKKSIHVWGPLWHFVTRLFFFLWRGVVSPTPNPHVGRRPLVGCPRLLFQYIRSYPPSATCGRAMPLWHRTQLTWLYSLQTVNYWKLF
jgi:hypothetical protein